MYLYFIYIYIYIYIYIHIYIHLYNELVASSSSAFFAVSVQEKDLVIFGFDGL